MTNRQTFVGSSAIGLNNIPPVRSVLGGTNISVSDSDGAWTVNNTLTSNSQLSNGAGYITSAPVTSVNGQTGSVSISVPTNNNQLSNGAGYVTNNSSSTFTVEPNGDVVTGASFICGYDNRGALSHTPEAYGGLLRFRLVTNSTKFYFRNNAANSWIEVATASDPKLKNIKSVETTATRSASMIDQLNILSFEWNEDELEKANLYVGHTPGETYIGFDANQVEQLIPGSTELNHYLPKDNEEPVDDHYRSIEKEGPISILAALVKEVQVLKERIAVLETA